MIMMVMQVKNPKVFNYKIEAISDVSEEHWANKYMNYAFELF